MILVVDEERYITDLLKYNLEAERYGVQVVTKASEVQKLDMSPYQLVIVDAMTQSYTGFDLLHDLKNNPATSYIPVLILSHSDSQDDIVRAFDEGADDYVFKPFSLRVLMARVRSVLRFTGHSRWTLWRARCATRACFCRSPKPSMPF